MESAYQAAEQDLAQFAIEAHGGLERWKRFTMLSVHGINGGVLWGAKGKAGVLDDVTITVDLRNEKVSHWPFGSPDRGVPLRTSTGRAGGHARSCTGRAASTPLIVQGTQSGDPLERSAARVLRRMRDVDVSEHSVSPGQAWRRIRRDRAVAGSRRSCSGSSRYSRTRAESWTPCAA